MADPNIEKIQKKLADLRAEYIDADAQARITSTEQALRRNIKEAELAKNPTVEKIIAEADKTIKEISYLLANDEDLTDVQRKALFAEKRVHLFWLQRLDGTRANQAIEAIEQTVDSIKHE